LFEIIGKDKDFIGSFLGEPPGKRNGAVERGLAALFDARVDDGVPRQTPVTVEGKD
jgi:hypothetical protein